MVIRDVPVRGRLCVFVRHQSGACCVPGESRSAGLEKVPFEAWHSATAMPLLCHCCATCPSLASLCLTAAPPRCASLLYLCRCFSWRKLYGRASVPSRYFSLRSCGSVSTPYRFPGVARVDHFFLVLGGFQRIFVEALLYFNPLNVVHYFVHAACASTFLAFWAISLSRRSECLSWKQWLEVLCKALQRTGMCWTIVSVCTAFKFFQMSFPVLQSRRDGFQATLADSHTTMSESLARSGRTWFGWRSFIAEVKNE